MLASEIISALKQHSNISKARLASLMQLPIETSAIGCEIFDQNNTPFLDCGGYGVFILGHRHNEVVSAVKAQLDKICLSSRTLVSPELAETSKCLADFSPEGLDYCFFTNSGTESTELAIKLARANGIKRLIALTGSYHGKTLGALSVTHREAFRQPFEPLNSDVEFININDITALETAFRKSELPTGMILEPIQGEGGVQVINSAFIKRAKQLCEQHNGLLIVDEIQSGMARTGVNWAIERSGVLPDIMLVGKGLSGGVIPCAAVVATAKAFAPLNKDFMLHSSTFGGSPVALAAAKATIEILQRDNIAQRAEQLGKTIIDHLTPLASAVGIKVRGEGLLIGIDAGTPERAGMLTLKLLEHKVITSHSLSQSHTVRLTPSALLETHHLEWLFNACTQAFNSLSSLNLAKTS
jgi:putrescine aminotransferase